MVVYSKEILDPPYVQYIV